MKTAILVRVPSDEHQTLGVLHCESFIAKSLELPWLDNMSQVSCIPKGEYLCKYTRSKRISEATKKDYFTYEIFDVPNRSGIRIHPANYFHQLIGCVALGDVEKELDLDGDGSLDIIHSGNTVKAFEKFMNYENFKLIIK